jgi:hypothetical protein
MKYTRTRLVIEQDRSTSQWLVTQYARHGCGFSVLGRYDVERDAEDHARQEAEARAWNRSNGR